VFPFAISEVADPAGKDVMNAFIYRNAMKGILLAMLLPAATANAQLGDILKQGENAIKGGEESSGASGTTSGASSNLGNAAGAFAGRSIIPGSTGNVAGILEYCVSNNFLGKSEASRIQDKLMSKLGGSPSSDQGYQDGAKGLLKSQNGKQLDLNSDGMTEDITKQICDKVLSHGKSLL
jgi:hypothetical protein